jgi:outer membrane cobalamin receptor
MPRALLDVRLAPLLLCAASGSALAASTSADPDLDEVTVTGRLEETLPQELARYGSRVETISSDQVQRGGYNDITQTVQALTPGLYISPLSGPFDYVELSLQGSRSSEVLWLVDGIRLNNRLYSTTTPLDTIPAHMVERIEILEGGEGLFYGTQSVAGTVNIVTKQFSDHPDGQVEMGLDTNQGKHANGYFRTALGEHRIVAYGSKDKADGFQPFSDTDYQPSGTDRKRGYDVANYGLKYAYDFGSTVRTSFGYQHTDATLDYVRPFGIARASNERNEDLLTGKIDISAGEHLQLYVKGYYHDWDTLFFEADNAPGGPQVVDDNEFWGFKDYGANLLAKYSPGGALEYLAGWDYQHYSGQDQVFLIAPNAETVHAPFAQLRTTAAFSQDVRLSLGARHNDPGKGKASTVWSATGQWDIAPNLFARTSFGTGFRLPDAYELFVIDPCCEQGNPNLKPERSKYLNVSVGGRTGTAEQGLGWELVGFFRDVKDLIDIVTGPGGIDTLENVAGTTKVRGGELIVSGRISAGLSANASLTVTDARPAGSSLQQQETPRTLAKLALNYAPRDGALFAGMTVLHTGDVYRRAAGARLNYGNYYVVDLNAGVRLGSDRRHRLSVRLENALDENYASRVRTGETDAGDAYAFSFRGSPRTLHASYAYEF